MVDVFLYNDDIVKDSMLARWGYSIGNDLYNNLVLGSTKIYMPEVLESRCIIAFWNEAKVDNVDFCIYDEEEKN